MKIQTGVHRKGEFSLQDILRSMRDKPDFNQVGAIGIFIGVVRGLGKNNQKVQKLELEAYEEKADETLVAICSDLKEKFGIVDVQIHHLLGEFKVGEDIVYVVVEGSHRQSVFMALQEAVERYKKEAPIFKKEYFVNDKGEETGYWTAEKDAVSETHLGKNYKHASKNMKWREKFGEKELRMV